MKLKIWYYNFWEHFKPLERSYIQVLQEDGWEFELDENNPDIVFFNSFNGSINYNGNAIKIGYVTEDMNRFTQIYYKIKNNYFDLVIGNLPILNSPFFCKHPLYIHSANYKEPSEEFMEDINDIVSKIDPTKLKFCCLLASHDMYGNRFQIYNELSKISMIECPGKFINNVPSFDDKGITKRDYLKNFIFNICPENHLGHDGYTSEKIPDAIASGCIPIYFGKTNDDQDVKIFNQKRIIRYDPYSEKSIKSCYELINNLMNNPEMLKEFYQQPVFHENAYNQIKLMFDELKIKFRNLLKLKQLID